MNAPAALTPRSSLKDRLEAALNSGSSADQLMAEITSACAASPNSAWEALAIVDQYYRRRRLSEEIYRAVKSRTEALALGRPVTGEPSRPGREARKPAAPNPQRAPSQPEPPAQHEAPAQNETPAPAPPRGPPRVGHLLRGRYRLEARLDYGGGVVFQALDEFRRELPTEEQRIAVRFAESGIDAQREFFRAQHLSHPNIARVIEFDRDGDAAFYTLELQHGRLLRDLLKQAARLPLPQPQALSIVREIAAALMHAHSRNVVHGRLDMSSVLIAPDGAVRVLNFDLPRLPGAVVEPHDDLIALCVIALELLSGQHPFAGKSLPEARLRGLKPRRPPGLHRRQWRALQRGLAVSGKGRNVTIAQWLEDMDVARASKTPTPPNVLLNAPPPPVWPQRVRMTTLALGLMLIVVLIIANWRLILQAPVLAAMRPALEGITGPEPGTGAMPAGASDAQRAPIARDTSADAPATRPAAPTVPAESRSAIAARVEPPTAARAAAAPANAPAPMGSTTPRISPASAAPTANVATATTSDGGAGQLAFQAESFTVAPGESAARIPVRRNGGTRGDVGLVWWTEGGSAHPGEDFVSFGQQHELIPGGQKSVVLFIPLSGGARDADSEFYVNIGEPSGGAKLGKLTRLKVIIAADGQ